MSMYHLQCFCLKPNLYCRGWLVGLHLNSLKDKHLQIVAEMKRKKKKAPKWVAVLKEYFGGMVRGDLSQWSNRRMRINKTFPEEGIQFAHMDFTTAYTMLTFSAAERNKWLHLARQDLVYWQD